MKLSPSSADVRSAGNYALKVKGVSKVKLVLEDKVVEEWVYVIKNLKRPLLGKPTIKKLKLLEFIESVEDESPGWVKEFPRLFSGLGCMPSEVKVTLDPSVTPFAQAVPRRVPAARKAPLLAELQRMEKMGVIVKVEQPTDWCAPVLVVPKKNNAIRVCIDFTKLNRAVKREYHPLPTTEETISELGKAKYFSKLDANSGYWQMKLSEDSQKLTTFITPFGRFMCKRLPFGISSAPEIFQREMQKILVGVDSVVCQMDDILIYSESQEEHEAKVREVLTKLQNAGVTLNKDKCQFNCSEVKFLGHLINENGIQADPEKTSAIRDFAVPTCQSQLRRFFGLVNYLGKFSAKLAQLTPNLRKLLGDTDWYWSPELQQEFIDVKEEMLKAPTLASFDLEAETMISTDASSFGLGAAVLQKTAEGWKPIAYASRSMTPTEQRYAQIEKEALAMCWACEKFQYYLVGRHFTAETDHKPLLSVLGDKELALLPLRIQRFRLRMMAFSYSVHYTPGEKLVLADALSRAPMSSVGNYSDSADSVLLNEMIDAIPISYNRMERIKTSILEDEIGMCLMKYITEGWPNYQKCSDVVKNFFTFKEELTEVNGIIFYNNRVYIPPLERAQVLKDIHKGHQGEVKCVRRAVEIVWWPGMTKEIREIVKNCAICSEVRKVPVEPLQTTPFPERPWWRLATDVLEYEGKTYMVVVDYFSRYIDARQLETADSQNVINYLLELFCLIGVPNTLVSDNAPYYVSDQFKKFLATWDISHVTSSPRYSQSNGAAERAVQTVKSFLEKKIPLPNALLHYRDTPISNGYSPAQLLFNRPLNSIGMLRERSVNVNQLKQKEEVYRAKHTRWYGNRHRVQENSNLPLLTRVRLQDPGQKPTSGTIIATKGREVIIQKDNGNLLRRNRRMVTAKAPEFVTPTVAQSPVSGVLAPSSQVSGVLAPTQVSGVLASSSQVSGVLAPSSQVSGVLAPSSQVSGVLAPTQVSGVLAPTKVQGVIASKVTTSAPSVSRVVSQPSVTSNQRTTRSGRVSKQPVKLNL